MLETHGTMTMHKPQIIERATVILIEPLMYLAIVGVNEVLQSSSAVHLSPTPFLGTDCHVCVNIFI